MKDIGFETWWNQIKDEPDLQKRVQYCTEAIRLNPKDKCPYYARMTALLQLGLYDIAHSDANLLLKESQKNHKAFKAKGYCLFGRGKIDETIKVFE